MATDPADFTDDKDQTQAPAVGHDADVAADLIREKLERIYSEEPDASQEISEAEQSDRRSPHQQFMHELSNSGKDLATIQTEWHNYYQGLPDAEKHKVWQEFYSSQSMVTRAPSEASAQAVAEHKQQAAPAVRDKKAKSKAGQSKRPDPRSKAEVKAAIRDKVSAGGKLSAKHHFQSLLFGLGMGFVVLFIFLFGFFNEVIIAPFIQPGRVNADTPLIVNSSSVAPTSTPEIIIPKINVEIPVNYSETTTNENAIENDLLSGVVHYPITSLPGQNGNAAFFGHSSNNIFNKGKYKFAFVLLHTLQAGDTFYLTYNSKVYAYKVFKTEVVEPNNVSVLYPVPGQTATATLITCDPPGTSLHRLIVIGQQISPDPNANTAATTAASNTNGPSNLPNDGPTLWSRLVKSAVGKVGLAIIIGGGLVWIVRKLVKPLWAAA